MKDNFDSVRISKIENGFIVYISFKVEGGDRYETEDKDYYAEDFDKALETAKEKS